MRSTTLTALLALAVVGCQCERDRADVMTAAPQAHVIEPEAKDGDSWLLDFGSVRAGATYEKRVRIENRGNNVWTVASIAWREGSAEDLSVRVPALPALFEAGEVLDFPVSYAPMKTETVEGFLEIESDDPEHPKLTIRVIAAADAPVIQACADVDGLNSDQSFKCDDQVYPQALAVDFGILTVTSPPSERRLVLRNKSKVALNVSSVAVTPDTSSEFSVGELASPVIAPNAEVELILSYKPLDGGWDAGQLEIVSDDPAKPVIRIDLKGGGKAPKICMTDSLLDFGMVVKGTSAIKTVTFTSCGVSTLEIDAIGIGAGVTPEFTLAEKVPLPARLAPGMSLTVKVQYAPTDLGADDGRLNFVCDDPFRGTGMVRLHGEGINEPACDLDVAPRALDYGVVSTTGYSDKVLFGANVGLKACNLSAIAGPTGSTTFTIRSQPPLPTVVPPNGTFQVTVRYQPTAATNDTATLTFGSDDPAEPQLAVALKGTGKVPGPCEVQLTPPQVNYGAVPMGQSKKATVSLWNFGTDECVVSDASIAASSSKAYSLTRTPMLPSFVGSNEKVDFEVTFAPQSGGNHNGTLNVKAGAELWSQKTYGVPLAGTAGEAKMCLVPTLLDFGAQAPGTDRQLGFQIQSCGQGLLEVRGVNLEAGTSIDFELVGKPTLPVTIAPGNSVTVNVRYAPSTSGPDYGRVLVMSNDPNQGTGAVVLKGNADGCFTSVLNCTPTQLVFPRTTIGWTASMTFTCVSIGTAPVAVSEIRLKAGTPPEFAVSHKPIPPQLQPGESVRVAVDYKPTGARTDLGAVEVLSDDCKRPVQTITLAGTGAPPAFPGCIAPKNFDPKIKWSWEPSKVGADPSSHQVEMTPIVVQLTDDNKDGRIDQLDTPDVVFVSHKESLNVDPQNPELTPPGIIRAVDGKTGTRLWDMNEAGLALNAMAQIAAADIDGDNLVEIVGSIRFLSPGTGQFGMDGKYKTGRMVAFEHDGSFKWVSDYWHRGDDQIEDASAISIADLDADGVPEIVIGAAVYDANGTLLWEGSSGMGTDYHGVYSTVADLDDDGKLEVVGGNTVYEHDGAIKWTYGKNDGVPIVVDIEKDGQPEIILRTATDTILFLSHTGQLKKKFQFPQVNQDACAASISAADFDGDGKPELAVPVGDFFALIDDDGTEKWRLDIQDVGGQCGASGAAAFDFEGDGVYEAVYHDTVKAYAFRGATGQVIYQTERTSATIWETPVIADVDADGHADFLITQAPGILGSAPGLRLLNNATNDWVATYRIWNQYHYHVTNVSESGAIPRVMQKHWKAGNNFRAAQSWCTP